MRRSDSSYQVGGGEQMRVIVKGESERADEISLDESYSGSDRDQVTISVSGIPISEHLQHSHNSGSRIL